jgi:ankyrin repeat protein
MTAAQICSEPVLRSVKPTPGRVIISRMENEAAEAIRSGDVAALNLFLSQNPAAVRARIDGQRTLLHVATDWPGHFPNVRQTILCLVHRGADLNAPFHGRHSETPLHWAASSDDVEALDALLDLGADIESPGSVIGGGAPLSDAVAFGCWRAIRSVGTHGSPPGTIRARSETVAARCNQRLLECLPRGPTGNGPIPSRTGRRPELGWTQPADTLGCRSPSGPRGSYRVVARQRWRIAKGTRSVILTQPVTTVCGRPVFQTARGTEPASPRNRARALL